MVPRTKLKTWNLFFYTTKSGLLLISYMWLVDYFSLKQFVVAITVSFVRYLQLVQLRSAELTSSRLLLNCLCFVILGCFCLDFYTNSLLTEYGWLINFDNSFHFCFIDKSVVDLFVRMFEWIYIFYEKSQLVWFPSCMNEMSVKKGEPEQVCELARCL